jgi:hypothetical protein
VVLLRQIFFAAGGCQSARTEFLRRNNFPGRSLVKYDDDVLLGIWSIKPAGGWWTFPSRSSGCAKFLTKTPG